MNSTKGILIFIFIFFISCIAFVLITFGVALSSDWHKHLEKINMLIWGWGISLGLAGTCVILINRVLSHDRKIKQVQEKETEDFAKKMVSSATTIANHLDSIIKTVKDNKEVKIHLVLPEGTTLQSTPSTSTNSSPSGSESVSNGSETPAEHLTSTESTPEIPPNSTENGSETNPTTT